LAKHFLVIAAFSGFLAVALGAFGAHALKGRLPPDLMTVYQTAVQYQFYHTLALLGVAVLLLQFPRHSLLVAGGGFFALGLVLFSGSLYALSFSGMRWLGAITPLGGLAFMLGWLALAWFGINQVARQ
jgi:uncharacterized membrane protein YgdD (TMEM256/DUF423 family)